MSEETIVRVERIQSALMKLKTELFKEFQAATDAQQSVLYKTGSAAPYYIEAMDSLDRAATQLDLAIMQEQE